MKLAYYIKKVRLKSDDRIISLLAELRDGGVELYDIFEQGDFTDGTDALLSFGGDGTFLTAAGVAAPAGVPILGVNLGRLGFLSANTVEEVAPAILSGEFSVEERGMIQVLHDGPVLKEWTPLALNEMSVCRSGVSMLGVDVSVDGSPLPTYWADGLLVSTSSGSTAYSLSVGGPICLPDAEVLIIAPVAPHNLNVRPLVVPVTSRIVISMHSRDGKAVLTMDNRAVSIPSDMTFEVSASPVKLKVLRPGGSNFINALRSKLLWGQDVRNSSEQY